MIPVGRSVTAGGLVNPTRFDIPKSYSDLIESIFHESVTREMCARSNNGRNSTG